MPGKLATTLDAEAIDRFHSWCIGKGQSPNTAKAYATDLQMFLREVGELTVPKKRYEDLTRYYLNQLRMTASPKTTGRRLTSLRAFARWAGWGSVLDDYVPPKPSRPVPHPIPEGIEGVHRLVGVARNSEQSALISLCGYVGMRVAEALNVLVSDINLEENLIEIRGKGDRRRIVPLSDLAWSGICSAYVKATAIGDSATLLHYQERSARLAITNMGTKAGLRRRISSHDLRATFATEVYNHTKDLRVVQELLGHASSSTTEIYTGISLESMRAGVNFDG